MTKPNQPVPLLYSFDLANFEAGKFVATRYPVNCAVGGDWVCGADSDEEAIRLAKIAAEEDWNCPDTREFDDFSVEFVDSHRLAEAE